MTNDNQPIYVSDLDGTLLQDDATLSQYTRQKLTELLNANVNITVASARAIPSLQDVLKGIPFKLPVIGINGAFITDFNEYKHFAINNMNKDIAADVLKKVAQHDCSPLISTFNGKEDCLYFHELINAGIQWYHDDRKNSGDTRLRPIAHPTDSLTDKIVAITIINQYDIVKTLYEKLTQQYAEHLEMHFFENRYSKPWQWLTIHDKNACKSKAIPQLLDITGHNIKNLTVFGDDLNDENMFKIAPNAIAVKNATDQIKALATKVIPKNTEDAVIKYIIQQNPNSGVKI